MTADIVSWLLAALMAYLCRGVTVGTYRGSLNDDDQSWTHIIAGLLWIVFTLLTVFLVVFDLTTWALS